MVHMDYRILCLSLCLLYLSFHCQGRPMRKRTISEVQLMHNIGEHKQVQERREWLQMRLRGIHTTAGRDSSVKAAGRRRKLRPDELSELSDMTSEEIQQALNFLEKLLKSNPS